MSKLLVFDRDGTLATTDGVPSETLVMLGLLQNSGHLVTVATGRGYIRVAGKLGFTPNAPLILENGGSLVTNSGEVIERFELSDGEISLIAPLLRDPALNFANFCPRDGGGRYLYFVPGANFEAMRKFEKYVLDKTADADTFLDWMRARGATKVSFSGIRSAPGLTHVYNEGFLDVNAAGINKGDAVLRLMVMHNLSLGDVLVFGNDHNDREMFEYDFGVRVAVGDCPDYLRARATHWIPGPTHMAQMLQELLPL